MSGLLSLPPFPKDVPAHPLLAIDYQLLEKRDQAEIDKLWKAATELGFCLKNRGVGEDVGRMFEMGTEAMRLPLDEKMKYGQGDAGMSFGYKAAGSTATDKTGALDTVEFINIAKDDALAWLDKVHREYPPMVNGWMESTIRPFIEKSLAVNNTLLAVLDDKLGLPEGALARRHPRKEPSGSESRCIKNPPRPNGMTEEQAAIGAHT